MVGARAGSWDQPQPPGHRSEAAGLDGSGSGSLAATMQPMIQHSGSSVTQDQALIHGPPRDIGGTSVGDAIRLPQSPRRGCAPSFISHLTLAKSLSRRDLQRGSDGSPRRVLAGGGPGRSRRTRMASDPPVPLEHDGVTHDLTPHPPRSSMPRSSETAAQSAHRPGRPHLPQQPPMLPSAAATAIASPDSLPLLSHTSVHSLLMIAPLQRSSAVDAISVAQQRLRVGSSGAQHAQRDRFPDPSLPPLIPLDDPLARLEARLGAVERLLLLMAARQISNDRVARGSSWRPCQTLVDVPAADAVVDRQGALSSLPSRLSPSDQRQIARQLEPSGDQPRWQQQQQHTSLYDRMRRILTRRNSTAVGRTSVTGRGVLEQF